MQSNFEAEKNRKAGIYTAIICGILLLLCFIITWPLHKIIPPIPQDLIEVNLGNEFEGFGEEQPLIKGAGAPVKQQTQQDEQQNSSSNTDAPAKDIETDEKADEDAAPVTKVEKNNSKKYEAPKENVTKPVKNNNPSPVTTPAPPKPPKPKVLMPGTTTKDGNNTEQDNGFESQGKKPGSNNDDGSRNGKPDSYGKDPGGKTAGGTLRVSKGDRTIVNNYIFMGDLPKAIINAIIKVSADGKGTFAGFDKGSTSTDGRYATAIRSYLPNIKFNPSDHESVVTVPFNFRVQ